MVFSMQAVIWIAVLVVLLLMEAATMGLTTIWFAGGALVALILALFEMSIYVQLAGFIAVSLILLIVTRPIAVKWVNKDRIRTNAESLIGVTAVVTEPINNLEGSGQVMVNGQYWTARTSDNDILIEKNKKVIIKNISGVKLIVEEEII